MHNNKKWIWPAAGFLFLITAGTMESGLDRDSASRLTAQPVHQYKDGWEYEVLSLKENSFTGKAVKVAVLDTEVTDRSRLQSIIEQKRFLQTDQEEATQPAHADLILSVLQAAAPDVQVYHGVVAHRSGEVDVEAWREAMQWVMQQHVQVINMSFSFEKSDPRIEELLQEADERGILLVAAAGNAGVAHVSYPASSPNVTAVGGVGRGLTKWTYSNFGPEIDFCAPSVYIKTADSSHYSAYREGTSYAAALISGMAARLFEEYPAANGDEIYQKLQSFTPGTETDWMCGAGVPTFKGGSSQ